MRLDASLPQVSLKDLPDIARAAEEIGFDALWTSETRHDPFLPCVLIAEHTSSLQFGTAIAVSFARSPTTLAHVAWDLAAQSKGRFLLGLGTQVKAHIERRFGMPWPESVIGKMRDQILAIRALWDCWQNGTPLNFRSQFYKLTLMSPFFNPGPIENPGVPIYLAGVNPGLARLAGEVCDGFHVHPFHSPRYLKNILLPAILEGIQKLGRVRSDLSISVTAFVATTTAEKEQARSQIAFYASTPSYRPVMESHGWGVVAEGLSALAARGEWAQMPARITEDMLNEFCTCTDEYELAAALTRKYAGLADRITLYTPFVPGEKDGFWRGLKRDLT